MDDPVVVAHVLGRLSPGGGVQVVVRGLIQRLDPNRVESHVITARPWVEGDLLNEVPAQIHPLNYRRKGYRLRDRVRLCVAVARSVRSIRPDVVQLHSGIAWMGILARVLMPRTSFVLEAHDAPGSGRHGRRNDQFEGWCIRRLRITAISHSNEVAEAVARQSGCPRGQIKRFALGVDIERFQPLDVGIRRRWRTDNVISPDSTLVVAVGRPAPSKRFHLAIEAIAHARARGATIQLAIVGVGQNSNLKDVAHRFGVSEHVFLLPAAYGQDLALAIGAADVLSSTSEYEGFGLTLAEGMACAIPVVAMDVGGVSDVVIDRVTGILVGSGDVTAHAVALVELSQNPGLATQLGLNGRARVESELSLTSAVDEFAELYRELAHR